MRRKRNSSTRSGCCRTWKRSRHSDGGCAMKQLGTPFRVGVLWATVSLATIAQAQTPLLPSSSWRLAMPSGSDARVKITEEYAKQVGRDAYFWAWPMVNMFNRRVAFSQVKEAVKSGPLILSPLNQIAMLTDY